MPNASITVAYVNPPKEGQRSGSVKTRDGAYYTVAPDKLSQFQKNGIYDIEYTEETGRDGRVWKTITTATKKGEAPATSGGARGGGMRETSPTDAERMFVCSMVNAAVSSGKIEFSAVAIAEAVNYMRQVWGGTFGQTKPTATPSNSIAIAEGLIEGIRLFRESKDLMAWASKPAFKALIALCTEADAATVRDEFGKQLKALLTAENLAA